MSVWIAGGITEVFGREHQPFEPVSSASEQFALEGIAEPRLEFILSPTPLHDESLICVLGGNRPQNVCRAAAIQVVRSHRLPMATLHGFRDPLRDRAETAE
jgi:hypothetical protein